MGQITALVKTNSHVWSSCSAGHIQVWELDGTLRAEFAGEEGPVHALLPLGLKVWSAGEDHGGAGTIRVWDGRAFSLDKLLERRHQAPIDLLTLVLGRNVWACCNSENTISVWM